MLSTERLHRTSARVAAALTVALLAALVVGAPSRSAQAQTANAVTGLAVRHEHGFSTLSWNAVQGAVAYQIERVAVDASGTPTGTPAIVGIWRANRTTTPARPTFADAGFNPGERFRWRVRVRPSVAGTDVPVDLPVDLPTHPYSAPVVGQTLPAWGDPAVPGQALRTQWEQTLAAQYTSDANEYAYTAALDAATDRVRVVEIGRTIQGRPINMFVIGHPAPPATAEAVAAGDVALVNCNVHGNEPSSREACLILARQLAFADDARTVDLLSNVTVLLVPTINGDGRAANSRGNNAGQDLNRDYSLIRQPETRAFVEMLRDYKPRAAFDGHEYGNNTAGDLPVLPPRHLNVAQSIFDQSQDMIEGWMYENGSVDGWWFCPYGCEGGSTVGMSEETILRNTMGLKNTVGSLLEARSSGGPTRPNEGNTQDNRRRKTYSALYTYHQFLDYYRASADAVAEAITEAEAFQTSNTGRIVFRGSRPIEPHPAPHPGESPPNRQDPAADQILEVPPCGYLLTGEQYLGPRTDGPAGLRTTLAERIASHGWTVQERPDGYLVPLAQPQRGLIPLLLDGQAAEPWTSAQRLASC